MSSPDVSIRPQLAVSAAIFHNGKLLLVRRARAPAKGVYTLPGGRVEFGETLHDALRREVMEETALDIEIVGLAGWREVLPIASGGGHFVILPFAARRRSSGEVRLNAELDDFKWLAPGAISSLTLTEGLPGIVAAAERLVTAGS